MFTRRYIKKDVMIMKKNISLRIICAGLLLLTVVGLFLPFADYGYYKVTLFDMSEALFYVPYVIMGLSLITLILLLINKKVEICFLTVGAIMSFVYLYTMTYKDSFSYLSFGYYLFAVSSVLTLIILFILVMKNKSNSNSNVIENVAKVEDVQSVQQQEVANIQPSEFAQSIMDKPVMNELNNNLSDNNLNMNDVGNQGIVDSGLQSTQVNENVQSQPVANELSVDSSSNEGLSLSPNNPLSSFLPSDFDPSKVVNKQQVQNDAAISLSENEVEVEKKVEEVQDEKVETKVDDNQSIMSIMSQPMVGDSGVMVTQPEVSQPPEAAVPEVPQASEAVVPEVPQAPEAAVPEVPQAPEAVVPEVAQAPEAVVPEVSQAPEAVVPEVPQASEVVVPEVPQAPEAVVPEVPQVPEAAVPEVPQAPQAAVPEVSQTPDAVVPEVSQTPEAVVQPDLPVQSEQSASSEVSIPEVSISFDSNGTDNSVPVEGTSIKFE